MDPNVVLPLLSSLLSFVFALFLLDQWFERRRPYQLIWVFGMLWYALSAGTEFLGAAVGWSEPLYRLWYLIGGVFVAGWLGLGTVFLLAKTRFGYAAALSVLAAGAFTYLTWRNRAYPDSGISPYVYVGIAIVTAILLVVATYRGRATWPRPIAVLIIGGSIVAVPIVLLAPLPPPGYYVDPVTGIPAATLFPGYARLLTPLFNITGGLILVLGALYSAYVFMPKRRVIRYSLQRPQPAGAFLRNALVALVAIPVNFVASLPGALADLFRGRLNARVPATILIAIGGFIPSITSGLNRFGVTGSFFLGELLGVVFLFAGFLVLFTEIRIPFTRIVLYSRRVEPEPESGAGAAAAP
jgi:hypothetical protein